ncbi:hypothetical protein, partial [Enterobacter intestinihominis]
WRLLSRRIKSSAVCSPGGAGRNRPQKPPGPRNRPAAPQKKMPTTFKNNTKKKTKNITQLLMNFIHWPAIEKTPYKIKKTRAGGVFGLLNIFCF